MFLRYKVKEKNVISSSKHEIDKRSEKINKINSKYTRHIEGPYCSILDLFFSNSSISYCRTILDIEIIVTGKMFPSDKM